MSQFLHLPLWLRLEPVLRFDCEGLLAMPVPYRSEGFAEDLFDEGDSQFAGSTARPARCEDARSRPLHREAENAG